MLVDARGKPCPLPVIALARAAADSDGGSVLELVATDPAARYDVPAWCRMRGHDLESVVADEAEGTWRFVVRTRTDPAGRPDE